MRNPMIPRKLLVTALALFAVFVCHYEDGSYLQGGLYFPPDEEPCLSSITITCPDPNGACMARDAEAGIRAAYRPCAATGPGAAFTPDEG